MMGIMLTASKWTAVVVVVVVVAVVVVIQASIWFRGQTMVPR